MFKTSGSNNFTYIPAISAAAAKSLQSCPTLCDPIDGSPPGSPVPGILQARTLEWVAISFSKQSQQTSSNISLVWLNTMLVTEIMVVAGSTKCSDWSAQVSHVPTLKTKVDSIPLKPQKLGVGVGVGLEASVHILLLLFFFFKGRLEAVFLPLRTNL